MSSSSSTRKVRARAYAAKSFSSPFAGGESRDALEGLLVRVDEGLPSLRHDAQQLVAMLIADTERHRHRNDAAQYRGPEGIDERLIVAEEQDQLVAAPRAQALQVVQDAQRALVEFAEGDAALLTITLKVGDGARDFAIGFDELVSGSWR
jgi:hypothetical protein